MATESCELAVQSCTLKCTKRIVRSRVMCRKLGVMVLIILLLNIVVPIIF
jgi:hypothetical protein